MGTEGEVGGPQQRRSSWKDRVRGDGGRIPEAPVSRPEASGFLRSECGVTAGLVRAFGRSVH